MSVDLQDLSMDERYRTFDALSHPTRVRILKLLEEKTLPFSALKHELGLGSSGQLQHHLQKLSGFVVEENTGSYGLTNMGRRALEIYGSSERSGGSLEAACCIPARLQAQKTMRVGTTGSAFRLFLAAILLAFTGALLTSGLVAPVHVGSSVSIGFGLSGTIVAGFFGVSFLIAGFRREAGCEIMAIPNLVTGKKGYYCSCVIRAFNLPNGRWLELSSASVHE